MNRKLYLDAIFVANFITVLVFSLLGALLGRGQIPPAREPGWILLTAGGILLVAWLFYSFVAGRWHEEHPRSVHHALLTFWATPKEMAAYMLVPFGMAILGAVQLDSRSYKMWLAMALLCGIYVRVRRTTWLCHLFLGLGLTAAPLGAWLAVGGDWNLPMAIFGGAVISWLMGFDILYSIQDVAYEQEKGLQSFATRFGLWSAVVAAAVLHLMSIILFLLLGAAFSASLFYYGGVALATAILTYQHLSISVAFPEDITPRYALVNSMIGLCLVVFTLVDIA